MIRTFLASLLICMAVQTQAQLIPLYPGNIPNSIAGADEETKTNDPNGNIRYGKVSIPTLEIFLAPKDKANGAAVVICPGGGYSIVSYVNEGINIAKEFNKMGISAFILKYRIPSDKIMADKSIGPLQDAQTAIKTVRQRAKEWNIDTARVGIIGFSAGGHLASTAGTHFNKPVIENKEGISLRPSFMILGYPVISFSDSLMHKGSKTNLLGAEPSASQIELYSNELQVTKQTPPTLLFHAGDDKTVKVGNSLKFYEALQQHGVPAELHIYAKGGHGFGINNKTTEDKWMDRVENWLKTIDVIK
ncbi:MAG: alpha/beta hydrolase [Sphingobacteriaceae bacterium]|jgi:acetyl esterase/lipase|nr:alpha/beta hydrolase [Sphingobacteriaceae bacterium]